MDEELNYLKQQFGEENWRWQVTQIIAEIPSGYLATYGRIAEIANQQLGLNVNARNIAWLRRHIYELRTHDTTIPLHRIAKKGDVNSSADSETTRRYNNRLRGQEGSLRNTRWL